MDTPVRTITRNNARSLASVQMRRQPRSFAHYNGRSMLRPYRMGRPR